MDLYHHQNKCVVEYSTTVGIWVIVGSGVALDTGSLRDCVAEVIHLFVCLRVVWVCLCGCMLQVMVDLVSGHR